jgi:ribosomal protein L24
MFSTQEFATVAKIKKGDTVEVVTGENKGARGQVQRMSGKDSRIVSPGGAARDSITGRAPKSPIRNPKSE